MTADPRTGPTLDAVDTVKPGSSSGPPDSERRTCIHLIADRLGISSQDAARVADAPGTSQPGKLSRLVRALPDTALRTLPEDT